MHSGLQPNKASVRILRLSFAKKSWTNIKYINFKIRSFILSGVAKWLLYDLELLEYSLLDRYLKRIYCTFFWNMSHQREAHVITYDHFHVIQHKVLTLQLYIFGYFWKELNLIHSQDSRLYEKGPKLDYILATTMPQQQQLSLISKSIMRRDNTIQISTE